MNARQKAKYYKRKYEEMAHPKWLPIRTISNREVITLTVQKEYPETLIKQNENNKDFFKDVVADDLANLLAPKLKDHMTYRTAYNPYTKKYTFAGVIRIERWK